MPSNLVSPPLTKRHNRPLTGKNAPAAVRLESRQAQSHRSRQGKGDALGDGTPAPTTAVKSEDGRRPHTVGAHGNGPTITASIRRERPPTPYKRSFT